MYLRYAHPLSTCFLSKHPAAGIDESLRLDGLYRETERRFCVERKTCGERNP
jgi:hypothetical protein